MRRRKTCPRTRDDICDACNSAEKIVKLMDAIMVGNDTTPSLGWAAIRFERWRQEQRINAEAARRAPFHPNAPRIEEGRHPGGECMGTTFTGMGKDCAGTDMDIDANGWYSNARRLYEECRAD